MALVPFLAGWQAAVVVVVVALTLVLKSTFTVSLYTLHDSLSHFSHPYLTLSSISVPWLLLLFFYFTLVLCHSSLSLFTPFVILILLCPHCHSLNRSLFLSNFQWHPSYAYLFSHNLSHTWHNCYTCPSVTLICHLSYLSNPCLLPFTPSCPSIYRHHSFLLLKVVPQILPVHHYNNHLSLLTILQSTFHSFHCPDRSFPKLSFSSVSSSYTIHSMLPIFIMLSF